MKVSCILPTRNRRHMLPVAINCYLSQDWPDKELVAVIDGEDDVRDLLNGVPGVTIIREPFDTLSQKRNAAISEAFGNVICHFDDDDWSAPNRISKHMEVLADPSISVTGFHAGMFWDEVDKRASLYKNSSNSYAWGATLCYRKEYALAHPWPVDVANCEDNEFIKPAQMEKSIRATDGTGLIVARMHWGNARRSTGGPNWPNISTNDLPAEARRAMGIS